MKTSVSRPRHKPRTVSFNSLQSDLSKTDFTFFRALPNGTLRTKQSKLANRARSQWESLLRMNKMHDMLYRVLEDENVKANLTDQGVYAEFYYQFENAAGVLKNRLAYQDDAGYTPKSKR